MKEAAIDPRRLDFSGLTGAQRAFCRIEAQLLSQSLEDCGFHTSYMLLVAEEIMNIVETKHVPGGTQR